MDQIISAKLNINPGGVPPRIKVSQYDDNSRHIRLYLYNGATAITNSTGELSNVSKVYIRGTKPDKHGFSYEATPNTTAAVYVTATVVLQMTAVAGEVPCELVFVDTSDRVLGTANFTLEVEPAALEDDTDTSETVLPDIIDAARSHEEAAEAAAERAEAAAAAISAGASLGKYVSVSSNVVDTDIDLSREPALGDRILVYFSEKVTDPVSLITYNDGTPVSTSLGLNMSGFYLAGNCLFELQYDAMLQANCWRLLYRDKHTAYNAGTGINIVNDTIHNTESGARSGVIDSISSGLAHTQITLATNETFKPYETLILKSEVSGNATSLRIQYASAAASVYDYNLYDTDGTTAKTVALEDGKVVIVMLDQTGYKAIVLSEIVSGGMPENPLATSHGGTGNTVGYIQTGVKANTTIGTRATIEGSNNTGSGTDSHTEGSGNTASGALAHAEGSGTKASGTGSHAGGLSTVAGHAYQTAIGKHNNNKSNTLFEVGNGSSSSSKSNALEVYNNGDVVVAGTLKDANNNAYLKGIVPTANGGTGNAYGYIRTGQLSGSTIGTGATAEGTDTTASGSNAHAEGEKTIASAQGAHAEGGYYTSSNTDYPATASGKYAHAEGEGSVASGEASHAEGTSIASGAFAHAEGANTSAIGNFSHSEGHAIAARGEASHVEGYDTNVAVGATAGHAEGYQSAVTEDYAHAEGYASEASGTAAHSEGTSTVASGDSAHAEGGMVIIDDTRHYTTASGDYSHAEGLGSVASGDHSHAEGKLTTAYGDGSHAEGISTRAYLEGAHAEGAALTIQDTTYMTTANGIGAHAEGRGTTAETNGTHAEGQQTHASAYNAHAEGSLTTASGVSSHAEGVSTTASAMGAHAEGQYSTASGVASHAGGLDTIAGYDYQTAIGKYNSNSSSNVLEVGNGEDDSHRSNALELTSSGYLSVAGKVTAGVGGELDFTRTGIYNGLCGEDNDTFLFVDTLVVDTDNSFKISECKGVMFRLGLHADFSMWGFDGTQPVTLKVNNTTAYPIKINGIAMTTDDWTPKQGITYFAQLVYENASDLYPGDPYWYISESVTADEIQRIDDALFNDDVKTIDYTNVITIPNAPDVHAQSLKVKFEPIQSGSGDPSPSNVRPISGHTGASAVVSGKNLVEAVLLERGINSSGAVFISSSYDLAYCKVKKGVTYTIKTVDATEQLVYGLYTNVPTNGELSTVGRVVSDSFTYTATEDCYFAFRMNHGYATPQIEVGLTSTAYVPPQPKQTHTTSFGDTYYSGYVDVVTGELVVTHAKKTITGSESGVTYNSYSNPTRAVLTGLITDYKRQTTNNAICDRFVPIDNSTTGSALSANDNAFNFSPQSNTQDIRFNLTGIGLADATAFQSYLQAQYAAGTPVEVVYELETPIRIALTPQLVKLFKGYNTIYSSDGQVRLEYTANLITCLNEDIAKKADNAALAPVEDDATAKRPYTVGQHFIRDGAYCTCKQAIASGGTFTLDTNYESGSIANNAISFNALNLLNTDDFTIGSSSMSAIKVCIRNNICTVTFGYIKANGVGNNQILVRNLPKPIVPIYAIAMQGDGTTGGMLYMVANNPNLILNVKVAASNLFGTVTYPIA